MHFFGCTVNFYGLYLQPQKQQGYVAQLNRASDYGSEGYRFESCRGHKKTGKNISGFFIFKAIYLINPYQKGTLLSGIKL